MELHETVGGQKLINNVIPDIANQLKRIADALELLVAEKKDLGKTLLVESTNTISK